MSQQELSQTEKGQDFRERVLLTAEYLYLNEGKEGITTRSIAQKLQYTHSALYYYFPDKSAIFSALRERFFSHFNKELSSHQMKSTELPEVLGEIIQVYVDYARTHPARYDLMFFDTEGIKVACPEELPATFNAYNMLREVLYEIVGKELPSEFYERTSFMMWAYMHGVAAIAIKERTGIVPEDSRTSIIEAACSSMGAMLADYLLGEMKAYSSVASSGEAEPQPETGEDTMEAVPQHKPGENEVSEPKKKSTGKKKKKK